VAFCFLLLEVGSDSILSSKLLTGSLKQIVCHFTCESDAVNGVKDSFIGDHVSNSQYLAVETRLDSVYIRTSPNTSS
jgi:hypothetical protein